MTNLKKLGLTALAGSLVASTAYAGALDVAGAAKVSYTSADETESGGNPFSMTRDITFSGSGETDQGWTITASIEADGASSTTYYDDRSITIDMGDSGKIFVQDSGAQGTGSDLVPSAYGSAGYSLASASTTGRMRSMHARAWSTRSARSPSANRRRQCRRTCTSFARRCPRSRKQTAP